MQQTDRQSFLRARSLKPQSANNTSSLTCASIVLDRGDVRHRREWDLERHGGGERERQEKSDHNKQRQRKTN